MKLIITTERELIREMFEHFNANGWPVFSPSVKETCDYLADKNQETITAEEIRKNAPAHRSWLLPQSCDECGETSYKLIQLGQEPDYKSRPALICEKCFDKAYAMMKESK